jgi:hypothetical protein
MAGNALLPGMRRSLAYEESLFETLAWYRSALFAYYEWLDRGDDEAHTAWRESATRFEAAALLHQAEYAGDLDFPAYDFGPALEGLDRAGRSAVAAGVARGLLAVLALLAVGIGLVRDRRPDWRAGIAGALARLRGLPAFGRHRATAGGPGRKYGHPPSNASAFLAVTTSRVVPPIAQGQRTGWLLGAITLLVCGVSTAALFAFDAPRLAAGFIVLIIAFAIALEGAWWKQAPERGTARSAAALLPLLAGSAVVAAALAIRGSDHVWFLFWSDALFRGVAVAVAVAVMLATAVMAHETGKRAGMDAPGALGATLIAMGVTLIAMSALLPDLNALLAALDRPLAQLPVRFALVAALTEYAGLPANSPWYPAMAGSVMLAGGGLLRALARPAGRPAGSPPGLIRWRRGARLRNADRA